MESFKFFTLNLPAIATIVIPVFLVVEFLVPLIPIPDFADDLTRWKFVNNFFNSVIDLIAIEFIRQLIGGIAWIAVIRVVAGAMHGEKIQGVQALKDGTNMLPMYFVTAIIYYILLIFWLSFVSYSRNNIRSLLCFLAVQLCIERQRGFFCINLLCFFSSR